MDDETPQEPADQSATDPSATAARDIVGPKPQKRGSFAKELPVLILIAFGLALLIKTFLVQAFYIPSESMQNTLLVGDRVMVNKMVYRFHPPRRGDIIVFIAEKDTTHRSFFGKVRSFLFEGLGVVTPKERDFIKRVIGLPGETVRMQNAIVTITKTDGTSLTLNEPYLNPQRDDTPFGPFTVPPKTYFVMGDNRANSADSRTHLGPIPRNEIVGRAFVRIWPPNRFGFFHRPVYGTATASGALILPFGYWVFRRRRRRAA